MRCLVHQSTFATRTGEFEVPVSSKEEQKAPLFDHLALKRCMRSNERLWRAAAPTNSSFCHAASELPTRHRGWSQTGGCRLTLTWLVLTRVQLAQGRLGLDQSSQSGRFPSFELVEKSLCCCFVRANSNLGTLMPGLGCDHAAPDFVVRQLHERMKTMRRCCADSAVRKSCCQDE
jgi:hypothetical protein